MEGAKPSLDTKPDLRRLVVEHWLLASSLVLGVALRVALVPVYANADIKWHLIPWYEKTVALGRFRSLGHEVSNYTPPYMYCLALASLLPGPPMWALKAIPMFWDFVAAAAVHRVIRIFHPAGPVPWIAVACFLLCPTVLVNGSMWAQCDVMYAAFLVLSLEGALRSRPRFAMVSFSIAFAIKLQAVFFAPALVTIFLIKRWRLRWFALTPAAYVAFSVVPLLLGRSPKELLTIYFRQYGFFDKLTMNAASVYQWLPDTKQAGAQSAGGIFFAASACAVAMYAFVQLAKHTPRNSDLLVLALFLTLLVPFLLPKMHERYFMASDLFACLVPFVAPSLTVPALLVVGASFLSYGPHMAVKWLDIAYASMLNLVGLMWILRALSRRLGIAAAFSAPEEIQSSESRGPPP